MIEDRFIRRPEVLAVTGVSENTLLRAVRDGRFPAPLKLGPRLRVWDSAAVERWRAMNPRGLRLRAPRLSAAMRRRRAVLRALAYH